MTTEHKHSLWACVTTLDRNLANTVNELSREKTDLREAVCPVVCNFDSTPNPTGDCFVFAPNGKPRPEASGEMPALWKHTAPDFRDVVRCLYDRDSTNDGKYLSYFALLLRTDSRVLSDFPWAFTFAAFDKDPRSARENIANYALGKDTLPNSEILLAPRPDSRSPLIYWIAPTKDRAKGLYDRNKGDLVGSKHFRVWRAGDGWKIDSNDAFLKLARAAKPDLCETDCFVAFNKTINAYWKHVVGASTNRALDAASSRDEMVACFVPVSSLQDESASAVFLLFSGESVLLHGRKLLATSFAVRGPFDSWQDRITRLRKEKGYAMGDVVTAFGHQVKNLGESMDRWSVSLSEWQGISEPTRRELRDAARLIPFPCVLDYTKRLLKLWSLQSNYDDLPPDGKSTLAGFFREAFNRALESRFLAKAIHLKAAQLESWHTECFDNHGTEIDTVALERFVRSRPFYGDRQFFYRREALGVFRIMVSVCEEFLEHHSEDDPKLVVSCNSITGDFVSIEFRNARKDPTRSPRSARTFNFGVHGAEVREFLCSYLLNDAPHLDASHEHCRSLQASVADNAEDGGATDHKVTLTLRIPEWLAVNDQILCFDDKEVNEGNVRWRPADYEGTLVFNAIWSGLGPGRVIDANNFGDALDFCLSNAGDGVAFVDYNLFGIDVVKSHLLPEGIAEEQQTRFMQAVLAAMESMGHRPSGADKINDLLAFLNEGRQGILIVAALLSNRDARYDIWLATSAGSGECVKHKHALQSLRREIEIDVCCSLASTDNELVKGQFSHALRRFVEHRSVPMEIRRRFWPNCMNTAFSHEHPTIGHFVPGRNTPLPEDLCAHLTEVGVKPPYLSAVDIADREALWEVLMQTFGKDAKAQMASNNAGRDLPLGAVLLTLMAVVEEPHLRLEFSDHDLTESGLMLLTKPLCADGRSARMIVHCLWELFQRLKQKDSVDSDEDIANEVRVGFDQEKVNVRIKFDPNNRKRNDRPSLVEQFQLYKNGDNVVTMGETFEWVYRLLACRSFLGLEITSTYEDNDDAPWAMFQFWHEQ